MARPRLRTPVLRDQILRAAAELLDEHGQTALSTRRIAAAADTSPGAISELFGGKPGLLSALALQGFQQLAETTSQSASQPAGSTDTAGSADALVHLTTRYRHFASKQPHLYDLMFSRPFHEFAPTRDDQEHSQQIYDAFTSQFGVLLAATTSPDHVIDAATGFVALLQGLVLQERAGLLGGSALSIDRRWDAATRLYLVGAARTF